MRPERLQVEGFTVFRRPTEVDFREADLFALCGPTGAGKSSLIDAICFALYGSVPRYGDRRRVEPVISLGATEARVRLDFSVADVGYSAVRVARVGARGGASTREARLERADGTIIADDADGLSVAVERLIGLRYEHFITCVVLPQGEFARLLSATPRKRQDLLVELLDLGLYEHMARAARRRADEARGRIETLDEQVVELDRFTEEALRAQIRRGEELALLARQLEDEQAEIEQLASGAASARAIADAHDALVERLASVEVPDQVEQLATRLAETQRALTEADARMEAARAAQEGLSGDEGEERARLREAQRIGAEIGTAREALAALRAQEADLAEPSKESARALAAAERSRQDAERALEHARDGERAEHLAASLVDEEPCPVCGSREHPAPAAGRGSDAAAAAAALERAQSAEREAREQAQRARGAVEAQRARRETAETALADLTRRRAALPDESAVETGLTRLGELADRRETASRAAREAAEQLRHAGESARALLDRQADLRGDLDRARAELLAAEPPEPGHRDLGADWHALARWARGRGEAERAAAAAARGRSADLDAQYRRRVADQRRLCSRLGIEADGPELRQGVAAEHARVEERVIAAREGLARRRELIVERGALRARREVAEALGAHLDAKHFEKWLLDEAMDHLVAAAGVVLEDLTERRYTLALDGRGRDFAVIDRANANNRRSVRTLSGGETFLASLALALALADHIAEIAPSGTRAIESIFLDEGFGSLDLETLETVATALEELGARGRMVGVVTHIQELAERLPIRFEVTRTDASSAVTRVDR